MKFTTQSGSVYQTKPGFIRRISGERPPTKHQGPDGIWKAASFNEPRLDAGVLILWPGGGATLTSVVTSIEKGDQ